MPEKEVEFWDYVVLLLKYKYLVAGLLVVFVSMGFVFYKLEIPYYSSSSKLVLDTESYITKYNIKVKQDPNIITSQAKSYEIVLQAVVDLDLLNHPIKPEIRDVVITKLKNSIPFMKKDPEKKMSIREVVQYYQRHINVKPEARGKVIAIQANSQDSKIASKLANRIGEILVERNLEEKNAKIKKTLSFIQNQIDSVESLLESNRAQKQKNEMSANFIDIMMLEDQLEDLTKTYNMLVGEKEHLNTMDILTYNFYLNMTKTDNETYEDEIREIERKKEEISLQKAYIDTRIDEVKEDIDRIKEELRVANKTEYYKVQDLEFAIETDQSILSNLLGEQQSIQLADLIASKDIKFLSRAYEPIWPNKTKGLVYLLVFFMIGTGASFSSILVLNFFDKRFKTTDELEDVLDMHVLGIIPKIKKKEGKELLSPDEHPKSVVVEAYRTLRTNLNFEKKGNKIKTISVTSANPDEGKTMNVLNLASVMAQSGDKVLVLDVDLRNPAIHKNTKITRKPGLTELLTGKARLNDVIKKVKDNMYAIPVGSLIYNPQRLLGSKSMDKFLQEISRRFDYVLCDTIPILAMSDTEILASKTDGTIIVMDKKKVLKKQAKKVKERLLKVNANMMGLIVNKNNKRLHKYKPYYPK